MTIRQRGQNWQIDVVIKGQRIRETCDDFEQAQYREIEIKKALVAGQPVPPAVAVNGAKIITMGELLDMTQKRYWTGKHSDKAMINGRKVLEILGAHTPAKEVQLSDIDNLVYQLQKKGNSDSTINRKLAVLSKMLRFAESRGLLLKRPKIEFRKECIGRTRYVTEDEEKSLLAMLNQWGQVNVADFLTILMDTGMRVGELMKLQPNEIEGDMIRVWVNKTNHPRSIPMTKRVQDIISIRGIPRVTSSQLRTQWTRIKSNLGLSMDEQFVPHCLRHTCASRLVQKGVPLYTVKEWLGHKSMTMTMRYAHLSPKNLKEARDVLDQAA